MGVTSHRRGFSSACRSRAFTMLPNLAGSTMTWAAPADASSKAMARGRIPFHYRTPNSAGVLPAPAGEIRKRHGRAAFGHGCLAQRARGAPRRGVVDVDVRRDAFADRLDQTVRHHKIHAAVAAQLPRQLADLLPVWMLEPRLVGIDRSKFFLGGTVQEDARRIVAEDALGSGDQVNAVVRLRSGDVVLESDHPALGRLDEAHVEIAAAIHLFLTRIIGPKPLLSIG